MFLFLTFYISLFFFFFFPQYFRFSRALRSFSPVKNRLRKHAHASRARNKCCESIFSFRSKSLSLFFVWKCIPLCIHIISEYRENIKNQSCRYFSLSLELIFHFANKSFENNFQKFHFPSFFIRIFVSNFNIFYYV